MAAHGTLPAGLAGPVEVALARSAEQIPPANSLPGGCRYEVFRPPSLRPCAWRSAGW
ncbi:hypothetical protein [Kribbella sp. HUAS MG21]|uniref:Uncharacterized protein n=1 Tax=Kribbella sp. HUAS MG21 TaxID=3160966 RepID=A0AAU7T5Z0_9ACTN